MSGIEVLLLLGFAGLVMVLFLVKEQRLADPSNKEMIHVHEMRSVAKLEVGSVYAELVRQSGNSYKTLGQFENSLDAFAEIEASFRRAKIDSVAVLKNTTTEFRVIRLHHSHGGKAEGKKLGGAFVCRA
jgi:hypothetical protein